MCYDPIKSKITLDSICDNELNITHIKELKKNKTTYYPTKVGLKISIRALLKPHTF